MVSVHSNSCNKKRKSSFNNPIKCHWKVLPQVTVIQNYAVHFVWSPVLMVSTLAQFITTHMMENVYTKQWLVRNIHRTSSTRMNNTESSILLSIILPPYPSIDPLSPHEISDSVSLVDSEWQNLRDSTALESILSSKGQFASSKLSINRDTWTAHKSVVMLWKDERS